MVVIPAKTTDVVSDRFGREHDGRAVVPVRPEGVAIRLGEVSMRYLCPFVASPRAGFENKASKRSKGWTFTCIDSIQSSAIDTSKNMFCS